jgi:hypothetical protein
VLGALKEQQHLAPRRSSPVLLTRSSFRAKKPFARAIVLDIVVGIFLKNRKKLEGGHHALGSPRAESVFALVQGYSLLSLKVVAHS